MSTGYIYDPRFLDHDTGPGHPERPQRVSAAHAHLSSAPWFSELAAYAATPAEPTAIESTHSLSYMRRVEAACASEAPYLDTTDVTLSGASCSVATLAAGAPLVLADAICAGEIDNGFVLLRPPGHHAESDHAMGFCLFNNVAIAARHLRSQHGLEKIAILDWDVHHGNGTQHSFESDPGVFYASLHQYPYYPGTGAAAETGVGAGRGTTLNCPMPAGATDAAYERAFMEQVLPALDAYAPQFVLLSAGFDAHADDPLADVALSTAMFHWMTLRVMEVAERHAGGRVLSMLEGGYHLERLADCATTHLHALLKGASTADPSVA